MGWVDVTMLWEEVPVARGVGVVVLAADVVVGMAMGGVRPSVS